MSVQAAVDAGTIWAALLPQGAPCVLPGGTQPLGTVQGAADFSLAGPGTYQVVLRTDAATTGTIAMSVPAASYDVRSISGANTTVARLVAGYSGVRVESWQLH